MASKEESAASKQQSRELPYGPEVIMMIGSQDASLPRTYEGTPQKWRNYQYLIAETLELPHWRIYNAVLYEKYRHEEIPKEDRTISCLLDHMSTPHHRARFFFEDVIPKTCSDPAQPVGKPRYCTADDTTYLRYLILTAMESPFAERMPGWAADISEDILDLCEHCRATGSFVEVELEKTEDVLGHAGHDSCRGQ